MAGAGLTAKHPKLRVSLCPVADVMLLSLGKAVTLHADQHSVRAPVLG